MNQTDLESHYRSQLGSLKMPESDAQRIRNTLSTSGVKRKLTSFPHKVWQPALIGALGVLMFGSLIGVLATRHAGKMSPGTRRLNTSVNKSSVPQFDSRTMWTTAVHKYPKTLSTMIHPVAPIAYESSADSPLRTGSIALTVSVGKGKITRNEYGFYNVFKTVVFPRGELKVDGTVYTVPTQYKNDEILALPLADGVVWSAQKPAPSLLQKSAGQGEDSVYYTPYRKQGGSLANHAREIASVPHDWKGSVTAVLTTAWSSWIPVQDVRPAKVASSTVYQIEFAGSQQEAVKSVTALPGTPSLWPDLDVHQVPDKAANKATAVAEITGFTRTAGGMVMDVLVRLQDGSNYGESATYYWSEATGKWTPLTQLLTVQTLSAYDAVGSQAVYWEQPLGLDGGFGVAQMHYNPATNVINSLWLGNWVYRDSYVDGASWVNVLASDSPSGPKQNPKKWTVYTP